eukprot:COSAG05_NODE_10918_length_539_cov_0.920455_1_plen_134_part_10
MPSSFVAASFALALAWGFALTLILTVFILMTSVATANMSALECPDGEELVGNESVRRNNQYEETGGRRVVQLAVAPHGGGGDDLAHALGMKAEVGRQVQRYIQLKSSVCLGLGIGAPIRRQLPLLLVAAGGCCC